MTGLLGYSQFHLQLPVSIDWVIIQSFLPVRSKLSFGLLIINADWLKLWVIWLVLGLFESFDVERLDSFTSMVSFDETLKETASVSTSSAQAILKHLPCHVLSRNHAWRVLKGMSVRKYKWNVGLMFYQNVLLLSVQRSGLRDCGSTHKLSEAVSAASPARWAGQLCCSNRYSPSIR